MIGKQIQEMTEFVLGNNYKFLFTRSMVEIEPLSLNDQKQWAATNNFSGNLPIEIFRLLSSF
jgi:hypothetical protein